MQYSLQYSIGYNIQCTKYYNIQYTEERQDKITIVKYKVESIV